MEKEIEKEFSKNVKNFLNSAMLVYNSKDYTSATILYFKSLFCLLDLIILGEKGFSPKGHNERFRILEKEFKEYYEFLDKRFELYRETYTTSIRKEDCQAIKEYVEKLAKEQGF